MQKSAIIFSDQNKPARKRNSSLSKDSLALSRDEYRQIIKEAYQEGREDALKEQEKRKKATGNKTQSDAHIEAKQTGKTEAIQQHAKEEEENKQRFETISQRQDIELLRAHSVFPFTIFADTLLIDTTKVSLSKKQLFATEYITTIPLKDLSDVNVQTYLFLGTLILQYMPQTSSPGTTPPVNVRITNLPRADAIRAKNILKGALVAKAEEIDIAKLPPEEIEKVLHTFGESNGVI